MVRVVAGWVQDRYADYAIRVDWNSPYQLSYIFPAVLLLLTIWMPHVTRKLHRRRHERVVARELELGRENAAFEWCAVRSLDQGLPEEKVILVDGPRGDAIRRVDGERFVLLKEPFCCDGIHAGGRYVESKEVVRVLMLLVVGRWKLVTALG